MSEQLNAPLPQLSSQENQQARDLYTEHKAIAASKDALRSDISALERSIDIVKADYRAVHGNNPAMTDQLVQHAVIKHTLSDARRNKEVELYDKKVASNQNDDDAKAHVTEHLDEYIGTAKREMARDHLYAKPEPERQNTAA